MCVNGRHISHNDQVVKVEKIIFYVKIILDMFYLIWYTGNVCVSKA